MENKPLHKQLLEANAHLAAAITILTDTLADSPCRLLQWKHHNLLRVTRNNLNKQGRILRSLILPAQQTIALRPVLPDFLDTLPTPEKISQESPSPHNGQPGHSD